MILYHMSQTLQLGDLLQADYLKKADRYLPYIQTIKEGFDCFDRFIKHKKAEDPSKWDEIVKCCVESAFEYIRETEFPQVPSRLHSNYYFENLDHYKLLYQAGWSQEPAEKQAQLRLFEVEIADDFIYKCDMRLFDEAYDAMSEQQDLQLLLTYARRYYTGEQTAEPVWEIISDKPARAVKDISSHLREYIYGNTRN